MTSLTRRQTLQGLAAASAALVLPGRWRARGPESRTPVALVRFAWGTDVGMPTPFRVSNAGPAGAVLLSLLYDTLTWKDARGVVPWLATEWHVSADGMEYTFQLVDGATWQDGRPLTADDVAFSFGYYAQHPYKWMTTEVVDAAAVVGDGTVRVALTRPYAAFLEEIAGVVPIIPRHVWEPIADPLAATGTDLALGSGPFRLDAYDHLAGAYRLVANDAYWGGRPLLRAWHQLTIPAQASVQAVRQGEADISFGTDASVRDLLADDDRLKVHETAPHSVVRLAVNTQRAPLDRIEVRRAIAYALDRRQIAETITRGPAIVGGTGVIPPETPWYNPAVAPYGHDRERARRLLSGERLTIDLIADATAREPDLMGPMLEAVGIALNVQRVDAPTRLQLLDEGRFQLALTSHIGVGGDPDFLRRWYGGEEANAFAKGSIFEHAEFARLGEEQAATLDPAQRRALVFRMQEILAAELPTIVLYHRRFYWVYDADVFTPMETWGGLMNGVPFPNNKLALVAS